ncbi:hypothetical protein KL86PLE_40642 [uncultured Pleomorphomonas sp.]|uniref:Uncharacterized protein n=1 Tax=uncultured Pleomorphomonas sp. TaxID=442121 RepID=A0A212LH91_9HYPH|nr:hypothetical protein KL86PLE_40642 [uncultured Pleomorphomonas sp.]
MTSQHFKTRRGQLCWVPDIGGLFYSSRGPRLREDDSLMAALASGYIIDIYI